MRMTYPILGIVILGLVGCSATPAPAPTATWTATAAPGATNTVRPTDLPSPTPTASPAPSWTPTGTPEATATATSAPTATASVAPAAVDLATWERPILAAGVALKVIGELEATAEGLRSGTLASIEAGGRLLGYKVAIAEAAQALDGADVPAGLRDGLRANLRGVFGVIDRWQAGELSSGTVGPELAAARADAEQLLSDLGQAAGLTAAQVAELLATLDEP